MYVIVSVKRLTILGETNVVVCTDLSGKEPHRQVGMDSMVTWEGLGGEIISTLAQNARDVGSIPTLGIIFPIFITPMTLVAVTMILYKVSVVWLLNLPCVSKCKAHCLYVSVSIKSLTISRGWV